MLVKRKKGEAFEGFLRRFNRVLIQSGRLIEARKIRFYKSPKSKAQQRESALRRNDVVSHNEYLARIGKLPEPKKRKFSR
ncbi:30S ribosomal protein S21 [Candidatus Uhrbacteria bacterium]|nr:30S ribosomal protein S21 [Candidatus Uhrbacteria bacterium]